LFFLQNSIFAYGIRNSLTEEDDFSDEDVLEISLFAGGALMGIIFHEIGHMIIDKYEVPIFNNEEDVADSFMAWYLIQIPEDYATREDYEQAAKGPHLILQHITDYYYYKNLLGTDTTNEYGSHSTDVRRFYNLACFMKGGNPEVFDSYIAKRGLAYVVEGENCEVSYAQMYNAWWYTLEDYYISDLTKQKGKFILEYEGSEDTHIEFFSIATKELIQAYADVFAVLLPNDIILRFEDCDGDINAYYVSKENKIKICYELVEEFIYTRADIMDLRNNL